MHTSCHTNISLFRKCYEITGTKEIYFGQLSLWSLLQVIVFFGFFIVFKF